MLFGCRAIFVQLAPMGDRFSALPTLAQPTVGVLKDFERQLIQWNLI
jgi:hypothetical protein